MNLLAKYSSAVAYLRLTKHNVAVAVLGLVDIRRGENEQHVLRPAKGDARNVRNLLQAQTKKRLPGFSLWTRLNFVESGLGSGVFLVVRVVGMDFLDGSGHLKGALVTCSSTSEMTAADPFEESHFLASNASFVLQCLK